jgi:hypothetical protein
VILSAILAVYILMVWNSNRSTWHIAWIVPAILIAATAYGMLASLLVK